MTHLWAMDNNCVKNYQDRTHGSKVLWPGHVLLVFVHCALDLGDKTLTQGYDTSMSHGQWLCKLSSRSNMAVRSNGPETDLGFVFTVTLTLDIWPSFKAKIHSWFMDNNCVISRSNTAVRTWSRHQFWLCVQFDLGYRTFVQGHYTPLGYKQQLRKILSIYNMAVRSYGRDTDFEYVCSVLDLKLGDMILFKVMTHPWVMDNNCVKYYPDQTRE